MKTESWESALRIGIATEAKYSEPNEPWFDDRCLKEELERRSHRVEVINWGASDVRLHDFDAIFVSSTWDIPCDPQGFFDWLDRCESDGITRLINAAAAMRDNVIKSRYMTDLTHKFGEQSCKTGSITPSRFYATQAAPADGIEGSRGPVLCEFECTEPNPNLKCLDPSSLSPVIQRYADAIEQRAGELAFSRRR